MTEFEAIGHNLRHCMSAFALATGTGEIRELPGLTIISSGLPAALMNGALLASPCPADQKELERRIQSAAEYYGSRGLPWSLWICEGLLEGRLRKRAEDIILAHKFHPVSRCPGMIADTLAPPRRPLPALEFRPVRRPDERLSFCHIMAVSFELAFETARRFYEPETLWQSGFTGYLGYLDGQAVSTAATMVAGGVIGLYAVATLPAWRKHGHGEAITRHVIAQAQSTSGIQRTALQSTSSGLSLYQHMGYRQVTDFVVYRAG
jgi:GNAT superfamily N-acetyltransferase